jgi:ADP-heptose:LPS heptosyltransferase
MPTTIAPERILFITEGGLGDQVALSPALRAVKESFPNTFVAVFATYRRPTDLSKEDPFSNLHPSPAETANSVFATNPHVDELYVLNRYAFKSLPLLARMKAEWSVVTFLRRKKFDTVISTFPHKERFILWGLASGAAYRVGARNQGLRWLLTHAPDIEKTRGGVIQYYCDLVRALGVSVRSTLTEYVVPESSRRWAEERLRQIGVEGGEKFVAVHPGASGLYKAWPPDRYAALIEHIQERWKTRVVMVKGEMDERMVAAIRQHLRMRVDEVDCSGSIGNLGAVLQRSALCISNDSGPRHLAVAVGTPSLAFFRRHHDREWDVYGDVPGCATLKSTERCPACPPEKCYDRIPEGEQYGAYCLRVVSLDRAKQQVDAMLQSLQ